MVDETTDTTEDQPDEGQLEVSVEPDGDALAKLREQITTLEKEKKDTYERLLRSAADLDNFRKRTRKETDDARFLAKEQVLKEILPGIDNLERAIAAGSKDAGAATFVDGVRLVLRQFQTALERLDVKSFEAVGQAFDPTRHEAISQIATSAYPPGAVAEELQKGYVIGTRLLRPALVAVAKAPSNENGDSAKAE